MEQCGVGWQDDAVKLMQELESLELLLRTMPCQDLAAASADKSRVHSAPERIAPEHIAPEHIAPEHIAPNHVSYSLIVSTYSVCLPYLTPLTYGSDLASCEEGDRRHSSIVVMREDSLAQHVGCATRVVEESATSSKPGTSKMDRVRATSHTTPK